MRVYYLTDENFHLMKLKNGAFLLSTNVVGLSFLLFKSKRCELCEDFMPVFRKLSNDYPKCKFLTLDIDAYPKVRKMSHETSLPIDAVPLLLFFKDGKPFIAYQSTNRKYSMVASFLDEVIARLSEDTSSIDFSKKKCVKRKDGTTVCTTEGVPYNTPMIGEKKDGIGIPYNMVCDKATGLCYITDGEMKEMGKKMSVKKTG